MKRIYLFYLAIILAFGITANAQETSKLISDYNCWVYGDSTFSFSIRKGFIHSIADSGIIFSESVAGNSYLASNRQLNYLNISNIEQIKIRRKGNVGKGMLIGAGVGFFAGGILGLSGVTDYTVYGQLEPEENALIGGILFSIPGAIIGGIIGSLRLKIPINKNQDQYIRQKEVILSYAIVK